MKPRLRKASIGLWSCAFGNGPRAYGGTPEAAYAMWLHYRFDSCARPYDEGDDSALVAFIRDRLHGPVREMIFPSFGLITGTGCNADVTGQPSTGAAST